MNATDDVVNIGLDSNVEECLKSNLTLVARPYARGLDTLYMNVTIVSENSLKPSFQIPFSPLETMQYYSLVDVILPLVKSRGTYEVVGMKYPNNSTMIPYCLTCANPLHITDGKLNVIWPQE